VIDWQRVPLSLWTFVFLTTVNSVVCVLTVLSPVAPSIFFVAFVLVWNYLLLRAVRWLWIGTVVVIACFIGIDLLTGAATWFGSVLGLIELGLLLAPPTRRFFESTNPPLALKSEQ
jgi:hypothetical protein